MLYYEQNSTAASYNNDKCLAVLDIAKKYMSTSDSLHIQIALDDIFTTEELKILANDIAELIATYQKADS